MRLKEGSKSIKFSMNDYKDKEVVFEKFKGQKLLLSFSRGASCPFCNLRINQLIKRYAEFEKMNINIITFFAATKEKFPVMPGIIMHHFLLYLIPYLNIIKSMVWNLPYPECLKRCLSLYLCLK